MLTGERDRLPVIAGCRQDDAAALVGRQAANQVESAANLERAGRLVVLMFDVEVEAGFPREQRMSH